MSVLTKKSRGWCFTLNNYTPEEEETLQDQDLLGYRYMVYGHEIAPTTGTPHLQGYLYYKNAVRGKLITRYVPRISLRKQYAKDDSLAYNYCKKTDKKDLVEIGEPPQQGRLTWDKMCNVMADPQDNIHLYNQYRTSYILAKGIPKALPKVNYYKLVVRSKYLDTPYQAADYVIDTMKFDSEFTVIVNKLDELQMHTQTYRNIILLDFDKMFMFDEALATIYNSFPYTKKPYYKYGYMTVPISCHYFVIVSVLSTGCVFNYSKKLSNYKNIIEPNKNGAKKIKDYLFEKAFQVQEESEESGQEN